MFYQMLNGEFGGVFALVFLLQQRWWLFGVESRRKGNVFSVIAIVGLCAKRRSLTRPETRTCQTPARKHVVAYNTALYLIPKRKLSATSASLAFDTYKFPDFTLCSVLCSLRTNNGVVRCAGRLARVNE